MVVHLFLIPAPNSIVVVFHLVDLITEILAGLLSLYSHLAAFA